MGSEENLLHDGAQPARADWRRWASWAISLYTSSFFSISDSEGWIVTLQFKQLYIAAHQAIGLILGRWQPALRRPVTW